MGRDRAWVITVKAVCCYVASRPSPLVMGAFSRRNAVCLTQGRVWPPVMAGGRRFSHVCGLRRSNNRPGRPATFLALGMPNRGRCRVAAIYNAHRITDSSFMAVSHFAGQTAHHFPDSSSKRVEQSAPLWNCQK